jgi:hypothetical protein
LNLQTVPVNDGTVHSDGVCPSDVVMGRISRDNKADGRWTHLGDYRLSFSEGHNICHIESKSTAQEKKER